MKEEEVKIQGRWGVLESENGVGRRGQRSGTSSERGTWNPALLNLIHDKKVRIKIFWLIVSDWQRTCDCTRVATTKTRVNTIFQWNESLLGMSAQTTVCWRGCTTVVPLRKSCLFLIWIQSLFTLLYEPKRRTYRWNYFFLKQTSSMNVPFPQLFQHLPGICGI